MPADRTSANPPTSSSEELITSGPAFLRAHPRALIVCAATEMWERFSYYGMRALLVFYLTRHFLFSDNESFVIYGAYTSLVYMAPVVGGAVADRWLGARKAVTLGGILLVLGHFGMVFEGAQALESGTGASRVVTRDPFGLTAFYLSLALIIVGVGFLKTCVSAVVGALYEPGDSRRDSGFTLFYTGYNIGSAISPLICGWVGEVYGWRYGFGLAGIGMLSGLVIFQRGQKYLRGHAEPPANARLDERVVLGLTRETLIYAGAIGLVLLVWLIMRHASIVGPLVSGTGVVVALWIIWYSVARCTSDERRKLLACGAMIAFTIGFWALYEQSGSSMNLFTDRLVNRTVFGKEIPASTFQSLTAVFVVLLGPAFSALWIRLGARGKEPSTPIKFVLALGQIALAFLLLALGTVLARGGLVPLAWLVLAYFLFVTGEMCLSPISLSMVTKLAPQRIVSVMMGVFFLALSASNFLASMLARFTSSATVNGQLVDKSAAMATYASVFARLGVLALGVMVLLAVLAPFLRRAEMDHTSSTRGPATLRTESRTTAA